ncbi:MAG: hypothetical protein IH991_22425, partial [Planctomycetes bacterium]|nr:hypothetical protein [Planctomycetota bacterium]
RLVSEAWQPAFRRGAAVCAFAALAALVVVLGMEAAYFQVDIGTALNHGYQAVAVVLALLGLIIALLVIAVLPGRDPLALREQGRTVYVYIAEAVAAMLVGHLYLVEPQLFVSSPLRKFWPYMMMLVAFAGVGVGELFSRKGLRVLAEPLQRTAAFLPLLPVLAFWVISNDSELSVVASGLSYSTLMVVVGLLYIVLCSLRRSLAAGVAAGIAGNMALWVLFWEQGFSIISHPQFWLIPPALCVLIAAQMNRHRLDKHALAALRYASVLVIYISSTAEMFIESASHQLWPPMILALVAVLGALSGILMRVRAFLYLGSTFLLLAVVSMVWHAERAIDHVWPWWAFGMGLGLCILVLFGIFEMKREQTTRWVAQLRRWDR